MSSIATNLFIGLMSGTSMDAVDAVLVDLGGALPVTLGHASLAIPEPLRRDMKTLCSPGSDDIDTLGRVDHQLGHLFASAALAVLDNTSTPASAIIAIGSHGQTIRHRPPQGNRDTPFTLQIGDPNIVAATTGICTVADFRRRDIALGGQGAPLVPAFHRAVFRSDHSSRAVVNIGGMANVTWLPRMGEASGFDTGPGNVLMDAWSQRHIKQDFDRDGAWAAGGSVLTALLSRLKAHPFFALSPPKTTGREDFNLDWLDQQLAASPAFEPRDVQATLLALTAESIAEALSELPGAAQEVFVCGGGALNSALMARVTALLKPAEVSNTLDLGIDPRWVECVAFAWLARQRLLQLPGNLPTVTGARSAAVLGAIYPAA